MNDEQILKKLTDNLPLGTLSDLWYTSAQQDNTSNLTRILRALTDIRIDEMEDDDEDIG